MIVRALGKRSMPGVSRNPTFACLLITGLPVKAEIRRYPVLRRKPLVVVERRGSVDRVLDKSPEAEGVVAGMTLQEALEHRNNAIVIQADRKYYSETFDRIVEVVETRFPTAERHGFGRIFANMDGMSSTPAGEAQLISSLLQAAPPVFYPRVGLGPGRFVAYALAVTAQDGQAKKASGSVQSILGGCSVDLLPLSPERIDQLHSSGVHTLWKLAETPLSEVQALLGADARRVWDLAQGIDHSASSMVSQAAA